MNTFGQFFRVTSFGESHGPAVGVVIDGCPAGFSFSAEWVQRALDRRRPGQSEFTTARAEEDLVEVVSGVFEGKTTGAPIALWIKNKDQRSADYDALKEVYRPSHADFTYEAKYGLRDHRGGGRSSARITAGWVAAGALAEQILAEQWGVQIVAAVKSIHTLEGNFGLLALNKQDIDAFPLRCPDRLMQSQMEAAVKLAKDTGDSLGGVIEAVAKYVPAGWGAPVFGKISAKLAQAMFSINAVKGFEIGDGFEGTEKKGSEMNDSFESIAGKIGTKTNHSGGVQGGITNGSPLWFKVGFKPTATIGMLQDTVNRAGENVQLQASGRHDPCVLPRAVPIVEAMTALVLIDAALENLLSKR